MPTQVRSASLGCHVMAKPIGPVCNLGCRYCYYLGKDALYPPTEQFRMTEEVLETFIRQYIESQAAPEIQFAWQGGEPTLMGLPFFEKAGALQHRYCPPNKKITNALQTNGVLLDDDWCRFFREHKFLIGLSLDGPRELHDRHRLDKGGHGTFERVMRGLSLLKRHRVEFNTLTVVGDHNSRQPLEVYRFLKAQGAVFMQFIPLVERIGEHNALAGPPDRNDKTSPPVTDWSVRPDDYGRFLCAVWDEWVRRDVGKIFVQLFDVQLGIWMGLPASLCLFGETCGRGVVMEHNGDVYSCDHYVYPRFKLGNITDSWLTAMLDSPAQMKFGADKKDALPRHCRQCEVRSACNGECPNRRFLKTPDGEPGLNYLCAAYKRFFHHVTPHMRLMADLLHAHQSPARIMEILRREETPIRDATRQASAGRNDPCPCGSGRKFKNCCMDNPRRAA